MWCWWRNRYTDQWNKERTRSGPVEQRNVLVEVWPTYFLPKEEKQVNGERIVISTNYNEASGYPQAKKLTLNLNLILRSKLNVEWITDSYVKHKAIKILEDNVEKNLRKLGLVEKFLGITPIHKQTIKHNP